MDAFVKAESKKELKGAERFYLLRYWFSF